MPTAARSPLGARPVVLLKYTRPPENTALPTYTVPPENVTPVKYTSPATARRYEWRSQAARPRERVGFWFQGTFLRR